MDNLFASNQTDCALGVLVLYNVSQAPSETFSREKAALLELLRQRYKGVERQTLKSMPPIDCYVAYYKRFGYTYHVLSQLETVVGGRDIPAGIPLVECMFMAELKNMLLTAGHDMKKLTLPLCIKAATGEESYTALGGKETKTVPGDAMILDCVSVLSSILRGPDNRSFIDSNTQNALFTVYAPKGIEEELIIAHLDDIEAYVRLFSADAVTIVKAVLPAKST